MPAPAAPAASQHNRGRGERGAAAAAPQPRELRLPAPQAKRPRRVVAALQPGHYSESPGSEVPAGSRHSDNESDGAVAAADFDAGDHSDDDEKCYDDDASDTEHVPSRLSTLGFE